MNGFNGQLQIDVRAFDPALRRPVIFALVDQMVALDARDQVLIVTDHEPSGLGYQIDLRKETRGKFEFSYDRRSDGAWVAFLRRKTS